MGNLDGRGEGGEKATHRIRRHHREAGDQLEVEAARAAVAATLFTSLPSVPASVGRYQLHDHQPQLDRSRDRHRLLHRGPRGGLGEVMKRATTAAQNRRFRALALTIVAVMTCLWLALAEPGCWKSAPSAVTPSLAAAPPELAFSLRDGAVANHFYRRGPVAAHLVVRSGDSPRIVVAFPAGNSGAALWLEGGGPVELAVDGALESVSEDGGHGIAANVVARGADRLALEAVLGSIRVIRDKNHGGGLADKIPAELAVDDAIRWQRRSADGAHHYRLRVEPAGGASAGRDGERATLSGDPLRFRIVATTDEAPLTPIPIDQLLSERAAADPSARRALAFLSYTEKLCAGSWRFLTYFGRDTLMSTRLLMPALTSLAIESALGAVIERLGPGGEVAHEEDIGEFPALRGETAPVHDYKMVDDDFMLAPVLAHYLLDRADGRERAAAFLGRRTAAGETFADAIARNLALVIARARPYAARPGAAVLIHLREGEAVGNWRDSQTGLGGGRIPYDVNAVLVPAALAAAARLSSAAGPLADPDRAVEATRLAAAWRDAGDRFRVELPRAEAAARLETYAAEIGVPPQTDALGDGPVVFFALALDEAGEPLPVAHTDGGFALLFGEPDTATLKAIAGLVARPFPAGLRTPVGVVVANPALAADRGLRDQFGRGNYHGTVVWSWQQALLAAGLERQLGRDDLDGATRSALARAQSALWDAIAASRDARTGELWSWGYDAGQWSLVPFGQGAGHETESNAAQLWSTVFLAVRPPR